MSLAIIEWIALMRLERCQINHFPEATYTYCTMEQSIHVKTKKSLIDQRWCLVQNYTAEQISMSFLWFMLEKIELLNPYCL